MIHVRFVTDSRTNLYYVIIMALTKKTTAAEAASTTKEKKSRKPREKREKCILLKVHPKYADLMQAYDKGNWVLIDPSSDWKADAPRTDLAIGKLAKSLAPDSNSVKVVGDLELADFDATAWLSKRLDSDSNKGESNNTITESDAIADGDAEMPAPPPSLDDC